jgi:hypothetical protein
VLAALNIALLRVMQADMEESHAQGAAQVRREVARLMWLPRCRLSRACRVR